MNTTPFTVVFSRETVNGSYFNKLRREIATPNPLDAVRQETYYAFGRKQIAEGTPIEVDFTIWAVVPHQVTLEDGRIVTCKHLSLKDLGTAA